MRCVQPSFGHFLKLPCPGRLGQHSKLEMQSDILLVELHKGAAVSVVVSLAELEEDVVGFVCCFTALLCRLQVAVGIDFFSDIKQ